MCVCQIVGNWGIREAKYAYVLDVGVLGNWGSDICVSDSGELGNWGSEMCVCQIMVNWGIGEVKCVCVR